MQRDVFDTLSFLFFVAINALRMLLLTSALWTLDWWGAFTRHDELDFDRGI